MEDTTKKDTEGAAATPAPANKDDEAKAKVMVPPLIAAGKRLERLLGGGKATAATSSSTKDGTSNGSSGGGAGGLPGTGSAATLTSTVEAVLHTNPPKIVRRWLGTSSGAAKDAALTDVVGAADALLDPAGAAGRGREVLLSLGVAPPPAAMDVDGEEEEKKSDDDEDDDKKAAAGPTYLVAAAREVEAYLLSLATRLLLQSADAGDAAKAWTVSGAALDILRGHMDAAAAATARAGAAGALGGAATGSSSVGGLGSKGLEPLLARLYRYRCLVAEKIAADGTVDAETLRSELVTAHRLACLRRDVDTQSTVLNLLLRELLAADQVEQAHKLLSNSTFPDAASNNQLCRYLHYSGRIQALRLEYTSAFSNLSQCLRKSPTNTGLGFRIATQRLLVVVQLLMGEIPERTDFLAEGMRTELNPYMKITQAVRRGDLAVFHETVSAFADRFKADGTYTLISRLAHSVVKAGLRRLNVSYSRISLEDVTKRLGLPSIESAEFVVAKAVRDGVIDATIDRAEQYVQSHDLVDVYATTEPAEAFHRRIAYCLTMHNDAVRGMRYPPDAYKKQLEASRGNIPKDDDDKTDEEKAKEIEDELYEDE
mmetsp:Transcript_16763/g.48141  ORF Transcript_16763/g.48141 Transcript_16763/m.48141 type:complete len:598 (+) Transcript_16763:29-1822(+)